MTDENLKYEYLVKFFVGGISGVISKTILSPLDRVKLILQTQKSDVTLQDGTHNVHYTGLKDALVRIPKHQGFLSLWRGNWVATVKFFPQQALNFSIYSYVSNDTVINELPYWYNKLISGAISGGATTLAIYPLAFCQTRVTADTGSDIKGSTNFRKYRGLRQCITKTIKLEGFFGLYTGMYVTVLGYAFNKALYFAIFDYGKLLWTLEYPSHPTEELPPVFILFGIAQLAAVSSAGISYPLDTISKRLMLQSGKPAKYREYKGSINCIKSIYRQYGIKEFFAGNLTNAVRSIGGALVLVINDALLYSLGYL